MLGEFQLGRRFGGPCVQDYDGSHIKGLLINMLHHYWPQLLQCNHFLTEFVTPIVKVSSYLLAPASYGSKRIFWRVQVFVLSN